MATAGVVDPTNPHRRDGFTRQSWPNPVSDSEMKVTAIIMLLETVLYQTRLPRAAPSPTRFDDNVTAVLLERLFAGRAEAEPRRSLPCQVRDAIRRRVWKPGGVCAVRFR